MQGKKQRQEKQWLRVSAQVLTEDHTQLQPRILKIYKKNPGLCSYATDLAQLRMTGPDMESCLIQILDAKTIENLDLIIKATPLNHPGERAFIFFADLVRKDLQYPETIH